MAVCTSFDGLMARLCAGYEYSAVTYKGIQGTGTSPITISGGNTFGLMRVGTFEQLPGSFETGVTAYVPTMLEGYPVQSVQIIVAEQTDLGSLDISGPTFTDNNAMPTVTVGNTSQQVPGLLIAEVTTALNATPGSGTITYKDQDNAAAEATASFTWTASATVGMSSTVPLNTGDVAVLDVTTATRTAGTTPTGVVRFFGLKPFFMGVFTLAVTPTIIDFLNCGIYRRLAASTTVGVFAVSNTAATGSALSMRLVGDS